MWKRRNERDFAKKPSKKEKRERRVHFCCAGQKCPVCKTTGSVVKRDDGNRIPIGDGMESLAFLSADALLPLECKVCKTRFRKAREPLLGVYLKKVRESLFDRFRRIFI